jgi:hypothetical protein
MIFVAHRTNSIGELEAITENQGIEIDVKVRENCLWTGHDPYQYVEKLDNYLDKYHVDNLCVVNIKTAHIETLVCEKFDARGLKNYFFLDSAMSSIVSSPLHLRDKNCLRLSEFESIESLKKSKNLYKWVWIDCFSQIPITVPQYAWLRASGKKLCLTGPDLLGRANEIEKCVSFLNRNEMYMDAICTKQRNIERWKGLHSFS